MAAKTIKNLLIGIGYDVDKQSFDKAEGGIDLIGKKALQLGGLLAGAFGAKALTVDFAGANDVLGKFSEVMGVSADDVSAFGAALELNGGSLQGFMSQLEGIEKMRAGLLTGDAGWIAAAGKADIDTKSITEASDAIEAYISLADQFAAMSGQKRLNAADALGLDEAAIRFLSQGGASASAQVEAMRAASPVTQEMVDLAADFNNQMTTLNRNMKGVANTISASTLPALNSFLDGVNEFFGDNRGEINKKVSGAAQYASDHTGRVYSMYGNLYDLGESIVNWDFEKLNGKSPSDFLPMLNPAESAFNYIKDGFSEPSGNSYRGTVQRDNSGPSSVEVNLNLDGRVIDSRVINLQERQAQQAIEDLTSSAD